MYDGEIFGFVTETILIPWYDGYRPLQELRVYPLHYHPHHYVIYQSLLTRGRKYVQLREQSHRYYSGVADSLSPNRIVSYDREEDVFPIQSIMASCRRNIHEPDLRATD